MVITSETPKPLADFVFFVHFFRYETLFNFTEVAIGFRNKNSVSLDKRSLHKR